MSDAHEATGRREQGVRRGQGKAGGEGRGARRSYPDVELGESMGFGGLRAAVEVPALPSGRIVAEAHLALTPAVGDASAPDAGPRCHRCGLICPRPFLGACGEAVPAARIVLRPGRILVQLG